jgi:serine/threonine-protein kinase
MEATAEANLPQRVGRYDVLGRLETGGMAEILLGQLRGPSGFEAPVVIKRILPHLARDPSFEKMFLDEARIAAGVRHPNVVHVHELGQENDDLFLVMEYLEGEPVMGILRRAASRGIRVDPMVCAHVIAETSAGLHAAHELKDPDGELRNVVHRDVSPSNVFITYDGHVKILDFGIAKAADRMTKTDAGLIKGKFAYMSPEQCRGEPLDRRSDVFGLGIVLYEMLTGRRLFQRRTQAATIRAVLEHEIAPPSEFAPDIPEELERICLKALSRSRRRRYPTAAQMRADLKKVLAGAYEDGSPEERLHDLMQRLFSDRIEEKGEMLRRVERGEQVGVLPPTMADIEIELPNAESVVAQMTSGVMLRSGTSSATRRWAFAGALSGAVALAAAIALSFMFFGTGDDEDGESTAAGGATETTAPAPSTVSVSVASIPSGAEVVVGGDVRGVTPTTLMLDRSATPIDIELRADGRVTSTERLIPDVDQRLRVTLEEEPPPIAPPVAEEEEEPTPTPQMRRRPRMRGMSSAMSSGDRDFRRWD